jgi:hypothetical protein
MDRRLSLSIAEYPTRTKKASRFGDKETPLSIRDLKIYGAFGSGDGQRIGVDAAKIDKGTNASPSTFSLAAPSH